MSEKVRVLRSGQARTYVVAAEHEDGSLLLAPELVTRAQGADEDGRSVASVPEAAGILQVRGLTVAYGPKTTVDARCPTVTRCPSPACKS